MESSERKPGRLAGCRLLHRETAARVALVFGGGMLNNFADTELQGPPTVLGTAQFLNPQRQQRGLLRCLSMKAIDTAG